LIVGVLLTLEKCFLETENGLLSPVLRDLSLKICLGSGTLRGSRGLGSIGSLGSLIGSGLGYTRDLSVGCRRYTSARDWSGFVVATRSGTLALVCPLDLRLDVVLGEVGSIMPGVVLGRGIYTSQAFLGRANCLAC